MNILFNLLDAGVGGGQRVAIGIAEELVARGHRIGVAAPAPGPATERLERLGAAVHVVSLVSLRRPGLVRGALVARRYDVVYSHTSVPGEILAGAAAAAARRPHVVHRHIHPHFSPRRGIRAAQRALYPLLLRRASVVAVAEHVASSLIQAGVPRERIEVIGNGVVIPEDAVPAGADGRLRVGLLGRLDPQKGVDVFIRAVEGLEAEAVVGAPVEGGAYADEVVAGARGAGVAVAIPPPADFLRTLDVVVIPSRWEGHPLVLLEAMALGKAIVASAIPGIREVVEPDGAAVLVPAGDERALAAALRDLVADPERRAELGARARQVAVERYSLADVHKRMIAVLERAAAPSSTRLSRLGRARGRWWPRTPRRTPPR